MRAYIWRIWVVLDILCNVLLGGDIETMSSSMGRSLKDRRPCAVCSTVCWLLSRFWPDHCINNIMEPLNKK
jgi:hypothetical protein